MKQTEKLRATGMQGVYVNDKGVHVDAKGVAVAFKELKRRDKEQLDEAFGADVQLPHQLLAALAFDPRYTITQRAEWAAKAAPYFAKKLSDSGPRGDDTTPDEFASKTREALDAMDKTVGKPLTPATKQPNRKGA